MNKRILIFTEHDQDKALLARYLTDQDYHLTFCYSIKETSEQLTTGLFDLVLVNLTKQPDFMLDVTRRLRQETNTVLWLCTEKLSNVVLLNLLKAGADNCLTKSTLNNELVTRIEVFFRRKQLDLRGQKRNTLTINQLSLCLVTRELWFNRDNILITGIEFELLQLLMSNSGKIVARDDIAGSIFNRHILYCSQSINMHISNIRKKLAVLNNTVQIKTVRGNGYIFVAA